MVRMTFRLPTCYTSAPPGGRFKETVECSWGTKTKEANLDLVLFVPSTPPALEY